MYISIAGNIGSGKSTIIKQLQSLDSNINIVEEPIDKMKNLLELFYTDMKRWSVTLQMYVVLLYKELIDSNTANILITERSQYESRHIFANSLIDTFNREELAIYTDFYNINNREPDLFVYVKTSPITCYQRMKNRGRTEEQNVPIEYLQSLHDNYEKTFQNNPKSIVINGEDSADDVYKHVILALQDIIG
jgi:deoxyadenosine/deoxycytidine kinase